LNNFQRDLRSTYMELLGGRMESDQATNRPQTLSELRTQLAFFLRLWQARGSARRPQTQLKLIIY
jgi:hypothetical protein